MLSNYDFSGSGWHIVQAVRKHTFHKIIFVKRFRHERNFPKEYLLTKGNCNLIQNFLDKSNIIHFKGDDLPTRRWWFGLRIPKEIKIVVTVSGSKFRRETNKKSSIAFGKHPIKSYLENSDFRTFISPDLDYPEYKGIFTPCMIGSESVESCWKFSSPPIIGYYPSINYRKGYENYIAPALKILRELGYKFEELPTVNLKQKESIELKKRMTIYIDQIISLTGYYGMSALEAMQFGIPTITYLNEKSLGMLKMEGFNNVPILNPGHSIEGLTNLLKDILDGKIDLTEVSKKTKQFCTDFHGYKKGAERWNRIYEKILPGSGD